MRIHVIGWDEQGRGALLRTIAGDEYLKPGTPVRNDVWCSDGAVGGQHGLDYLGMREGQLLWRVVRMDPLREDAPHETATTDIDTVLFGWIELVLDTGRVRLNAGDSVVIPGVPHGWSVGPEGCVLSVVMHAAPK